MPVMRCSSSRPGSLALMFLCCFLFGCGGKNNVIPPPPPTLQSISVGPQGSSVAAGLTQQFNATETFSDGTTKPAASATWTTSDPTLATVSSTGLVTTLKKGNVTISAAVGSFTCSVSFTVGPPVPVTLNISPAAPQVLLGASQPTKVSAILNFTDSSTQDASAQADSSETNGFLAAVATSRNTTALHDRYTNLTTTNTHFSPT